MVWTKIADLKSTVPGPAGPIGLPGTNAVPADAAVAGYASTAGTSATRTALEAGQLNLLNSSAVGDGVTDDTLAIQAFIDAASDGSVIKGQRGKTYLTTGITINSKSHIVLDGNGATFAIKATGARTLAFTLAGTCTDVELRGLRIIGSGVVADAHFGIACNSGQTLTNIRVVNCHIENVIAGISFSADGSGAIDGLLYENNYIKNVVGSDTGQGYGMHVAISGTQPANVRMIGNHIRSAQRHSIYQAKGRGVTISNNVIENHRDADTTGAIFPAIMIARSADVSIMGNVVQRSRGGSIYLGGIATGDLQGPYIVTGNTFSEAQDAAALMYVGQQAPSTEGTPHGVIVSGNTFTNTDARPLIQIFNGLGLSFRGNKFTIASTTATTAVVLNGVGVTGNDYMNDVAFEDNEFDVAVAGTPLFRFSPGVEAYTTNFSFRNNRKVGARLGLTFTSSASITNPNIRIQDQPRDGLSLSSGVATVAQAVGGPTVTAAPAAGGAGALPATPAGYVTVNINGTDRKMPYY